MPNLQPRAYSPEVKEIVELYEAGMDRKNFGAKPNHNGLAHLILTSDEMKRLKHELSEIVRGRHPASSFAVLSTDDDVTELLNTLKEQGVPKRQLSELRGYYRDSACKRYRAA